jgi:hypothetical protein
MPLKDFRWLKESEIDVLDFTKMTEHQEKGYILEVDMHTPPSLHREFNSFPLAAEHLTVTKDMLSPYAKECQRQFNGGHKDYKAKKLCGTLLEKKNYCVHYRNLQVYYACAKVFILFYFKSF